MKRTRAATAAEPAGQSRSPFVIARVHAREILDSRGNPTVEADVLLAGSARGRAAVPSGASTGKYEAVELRDGASAYGGQGVLKAVANVNVAIDRKVRGMDARAQAALDQAMISLDGTPDKSRLGANALLAVSLAAARAAARAKGVELYEHLAVLTGREPRLPIPFSNVINGGKHADGKLKPQEFMIVPHGATSFAEAAELVSETYHILRSLLQERFGATAIHVGDEGGFAPPLETPEQALDFLTKAIKRAGHQGRVAIALDPAASEFYDGKEYDLGFARLAPEALVEYWRGLIKKYDVISLEDPFDQEDYLSWNMLSAKLTPFQIIGDDLTVTNTARIQRAIDERLCNTLLLKVNQIGTLTEALNAAMLARAAGWNVQVSHRSGETEDSFIADLTVALGCGQIKLGAPCRGERTAKYNRLLRIEEHLGRKARFARFSLPREEA